MKTLLLSALALVLQCCATPLPANVKARYDCDGKFDPSTGKDIRK